MTILLKDFAFNIQHYPKLRVLCDLRGEKIFKSYFMQMANLLFKE